jgi:hypothetical protein
MPRQSHEDPMLSMLRARGLKFPRWAVEEARRVGIPLSYALAFLEKESTGHDEDGEGKFGLNLFGHDPVNNPVRGGFVTRSRYASYLANRKRGLGMQGVGPMQLTWWQFQDMADQQGGCWHPQYNMRVGFAIAKRLIRESGKHDGVRRWNGTGAAAEAYADDWSDRERRWRHIIAGVADTAEDGKDGRADAPRPLRLTSPYKKGKDVRALQKALNERAHARNLPTIDVDGEYGPRTAAAVRRIGWALGALEATLDQGATLGLQTIIRDPKRRNGDQLRRARQRARAAVGASGAAQRTVAWCRAQVKTTESPPGTNRGPKITHWQAEFGNPRGGWPWCGAFVGYALRHHGGVAVPAGVVYTPNIYAWARSRTAGFEDFYEWKDRQLGDLVLFKFSSGGDIVQHVGIYAGNGITIEGNTSSGSAGSQDNGGGVFERNRNGQDVVGCARPRY